jgi:hypothetical protein
MEGKNSAYMNHNEFGYQPNVLIPPKAFRNIICLGAAHLSTVSTVLHRLQNADHSLTLYSL